jgi:hypothetical protein
MDQQMVDRDALGGVHGLYQKVLKDRVGDETGKDVVVQLDLLVVEGVEDGVDFRLMRGIYVVILLKRL